MQIRKNDDDGRQQDRPEGEHLYKVEHRRRHRSPRDRGRRLGGRPEAWPSESKGNEKDQTGGGEKEGANEMKPSFGITGSGAGDAQAVDHRLQGETGPREKFEMHVDHAGDDGPGDPCLEGLRGGTAAPAADRAEYRYG